MCTDKHTCMRAYLKIMHVDSVIGRNYHAMYHVLLLARLVSRVIVLHYKKKMPWQQYIPRGKGVQCIYSHLDWMRTWMSEYCQTRYVECSHSLAVTLDHLSRSWLSSTRNVQICWYELVFIHTIIAFWRIWWRIVRAANTNHRWPAGRNCHKLYGGK